jgi:GAF domain-containing protein
VLGDRTIGALQLHRAGTAASDITERGNQRWNDADLNFVQAVLDQVAQSAENLRLFEETQERAGRERVIREVTDRLRVAPNLDRLLEIATTEISHLFPVAHAELSLHVEGQPENGYDMTNGNPDHKVSDA